MSQKIMRPELAEIAGVMRLAHDLDITSYDPEFLNRSLEKRLAVLGLKSRADYTAALPRDRAEAEAFYGSLTISHSEFFRNPLTFALLEQLVLPGLLERTGGARELRVWSAGCAAGQEAYSLAILLAELAARRGRPLNARIFATDISAAELADAKAGVYAAEEVRNVRLELLNKYFRAAGGTYEVAEEIKALVDFSAHDLLDGRYACPPPAIFGDFDLVACGNLLFYYKPAVRLALLEKVYNALAPKGYLVTGEAEREIAAAHPGFRLVASPVPVFQKAD